MSSARWWRGEQRCGARAREQRAATASPRPSHTKATCTAIASTGWVCSLIAMEKRHAEAGARCAKRNAGAPLPPPGAHLPVRAITRGEPGMLCDREARAEPAASRSSRWAQRCSRSRLDNMAIVLRRSGFRSSVGTSGLYRTCERGCRARWRSGQYSWALSDVLRAKRGRVLPDSCSIRFLFACAYIQVLPAVLPDPDRAQLAGPPAPALPHAPDAPAHAPRVLPSQATRCGGQGQLLLRTAPAEAVVPVPAG